MLLSVHEMCKINKTRPYYKTA